MTKRRFGKRLGFGAIMAAALAAPSARAQQAEPAPKAGKLINAGDVLSGELNAMKVRGGIAQQAEPAPKAGKLINAGDVLSGELNAMKVRGGKKGVSTYQLTSEPRRLPPPNGLCNLETGPETFQLITSSEAQAAQLRKFNGKEISVKVDEVACAQDAGQMSEAVVTKWSVVTKH